MTTIYERMKAALTPLGLPLATDAKKLASGSELPDSYLIYFIVSDPPLLHADDIEKLSLYRVQVSYFSRAGMQTIPDIAGTMKAAGFMRVDQRALPYNPDSRHYGLALDFTYLEEE